MTSSTEERAETTTAAARAGATIAHDRFRGELDVESKGARTDLVTGADRAAQRAVIETIREDFPRDPIVGEEADARTTLVEEGPCWVVDPIDGTTNFVRGFRTFGTAVAALVDGKVVAATTVLPALGDTYHVSDGTVRRNGDQIAVSDRSDPDVAAVCPTLWWDPGRADSATTAVVERFADLRRLGCAQAELAAVADGSLEAAISDITGAPWDTLAGVAMVRAAGGRVTDIDGNRWHHDSQGIVASNGAVHDALLAAIQSTS